MAALSAKRWPELKAAWDEYGFNDKWEDIVDAKVRADGYYVVFLVKEGKDSFQLVDFAKGEDWEVQNDGSDNITMKQWEQLKIVPQCDWYEYPDDEKMAVIEHEELVQIENTKYRDAFLIYQEGYDAGMGNDLVNSWLSSTACEKVKAAMKGKKK